jgi:hypothetical protein
MESFSARYRADDFIEAYTRPYRLIVNERPVYRQNVDLNRGMYGVV